MPYEWVASALGGGERGLYGVIIVILAMTIYLSLRSRIKELADENKDIRDSLGRLTDVVEAWTPEAQRRRLQRPKS